MKLVFIFALGTLVFLASNLNAQSPVIAEFLSEHGLALPLLDQFTSGLSAAEQSDTPRRMIFICTSLGLHGPNFFPERAGRNYLPAKYLKLLERRRDDYTVFSGLSDPEQAGNDGHASQRTWLTGAPNPDANSHDWHNLPILLAGGDFRHGQHRVYDKDNNLPLSNLFLSMLQSQGHEIDHFGSSTGTIDLNV